MTQLMRTITKVKKHINPKLSIDGILLTLVDNRTNLAKSTIDALRENFGSYIKIYTPEASYVLEYNPNVVPDEEIIKMAESAEVPEDK